MRTRRRSRALLLLLLSVLLLAGCWDRREIEERSTVLASGVDICAEGADPSCKVIVTRQIAIPGRIPQGSAAEGGSAARRGEAVYLLASPGRDILDSTRVAQAELNRTITFGHIRVLVLSEEFAMRGTNVYFDYVRRLPDARRLMWVLIADGRAEDVMRARPPLERVPALYLSDMMDDAVKTGRMPRVYWGDLLVRLSNKGEDAIAPLIRMAGPDEPQLAGLAVFRGDRMVGRLSAEETTTYMEVQGLRRGRELLKVTLPGGGWANVTVYGRGTNYKLSQVGGRIHATVTMELETELAQLCPGWTSSDPQVVDAIERQTSAMVTGRAEALVDRLQHELGADILALGERVRSRMPAVWKSIPDWQATFAEAQFRFEVESHLRRTGMSTD